MTRDIRCRSRWGHRPNVSRISLLKHGRRRTKTVDLGVLDMGSTLLRVGSVADEGEELRGQSLPEHGLHAFVQCVKAGNLLLDGLVPFAFRAEVPIEDPRHYLLGIVGPAQGGVDDERAIGGVEQGRRHVERLIKPLENLGIA